MTQLINVFTEVQILIVMSYCLNLYLRPNETEESKVSMTFIFTIVYISYSAIIPLTLLVILIARIISLIYHKITKLIHPQRLPIKPYRKTDLFSMADAPSSVD